MVFILNIQMLQISSETIVRHNHKITYREHFKLIIQKCKNVTFKFFYFVNGNIVFNVYLNFLKKNGKIPTNVSRLFNYLIFLKFLNFFEKPLYTFGYDRPCFHQVFNTVQNLNQWQSELSVGFNLYVKKYQKLFSKAHLTNQYLEFLEARSGS